MSDYCRLCLDNDNNSNSVFDKRAGFSIADKIFELFNIEIDPVDKFSKCICNECLAIIIKAYELRDKGAESQKYLLSSDFPQTRIKLEAEVEIEEAEIEDPFSYDPLKNEAVDDDIIKYDPMPPPKIAAAPFHDQLDDNSEGEDDLLVEESEEKHRERIESSAKKLKPEKKLICRRCSKIFPHQSTLVAHFNNEHNDIKRPHKCHKCHNQFQRRVELNEHLKIHEIDADASRLFESDDEKKRRRCAVCFQSFNLLSVLKLHWERKHDAVVNPFSCAYCHARSTHEPGIIQHLKIEHNKLSQDQSIVLIREGVKATKINNAYIVPRMAIYVNPVEAAKNAPYEAKKIKNELNRLEREKNNPQSKLVGRYRKRPKYVKRGKSAKSTNVHKVAEDDEDVIMFDVEPATDPLQGGTSDVLDSSFDSYDTSFVTFKSETQE